MRTALMLICAIALPIAACTKADNAEPDKIGQASDGSEVYFGDFYAKRFNFADGTRCVTVTRFTYNGTAASVSCDFKPEQSK